MISPTETRLRSIRALARVDTAEARIRRYIVESALQPGDRLPSEAELAATLGSSRVVIREALGMLEALGVLEARVGSGWFV
ncbi:MAG: FadR/GntR family transcriptional regulator, partial [Haloechinothrix sp.]